ncbi:MAG TPA: DedA family protein [Acidobacteriaceae bacterium]|jgi:membrane protein DedA with SNARE-associated domain|nr:DedA family protein [Acidobacteriaceae bacterium]
MSEHILASVAHFIQSFISTAGYGGVLLLMAIESACVPLPSEIIMPFAGYLVHTGRLSLIGVATAGALGCNLGSLIAYWIGAYGGRPFITRYGRFVLLNPHDLARAEHFFGRFGGITVFLGRLLPVVRTFIALPAGIARMPQLRFHLYTFLGSWPWCFVLAWVGMKLGQAWDTDPRFKAAFHRFHLGVEILIVAAFLWFLWTHWRHRIRPEENQPS